MKIKKIRAKTFREALALVRKELGEDAVILSSDDKKDGKSYVEVTAAVDFDIENSAEMETAPASQFAAPGGAGDLVELKNEIRGLREAIESMKNTGLEIKLPDEMKQIYSFLKNRSIREEFAMALAERANAIEDLERLMAEDIKASASDDEHMKAYADDRKIFMLIGPTGVGKTTTVAKLASKAVRDGKKTAIISIDTFKIGATEQIRIYSRMIGIPLDIVSNLESLKRSIERFSDKDIVLIDTAGQNPDNSEYIQGLNEICRAGLPIETHLLLSTSSDGDFLMDTQRHYSSLPVDRIAFTKTDEAVRHGSIYNLCRVYKKPVAYITTGQRVPGNIEFIDSRKLTNLILRTGCA